MITPLDIHSISHSSCSTFSLCQSMLSDSVWLSLSLQKVESSRTLVQLHIAPWNGPRGAFALVGESQRNHNDTFLFIHAISFYHFKEIFCHWSVVGHWLAVGDTRRTLIRNLLLNSYSIKWIWIRHWIRPYVICLVCMQVQEALGDLFWVIAIIPVPSQDKCFSY